MTSEQIINLVMSIILLITAVLYFIFWKVVRKEKPSTRTVVLNTLLVGVGVWYAWDFIASLL